MQIMQNPVVAVMMTLALVLGGNWLREQWKNAQAERAAREAIRNAVFEKLAEAVAALMATVRVTHEDVVAQLESRQTQIALADQYLKEATAAHNIFLTGTVKACEAIAVATNKHRETVKEFGKLVFGNDPGKDALQVPTEADKDRIHSLMSHRAAGHTEEEAETLADLDAERAASAAYPAE